MVLNEITPGLEAKLAPTDCRLRPDQHFLELGEYDKVGGRGVGGRQLRRIALPCRPRGRTARGAAPLALSFVRQGAAGASVALLHFLTG